MCDFGDIPLEQGLRRACLASRGRVLPFWRHSIRTRIKTGQEALRMHTYSHFGDIPLEQGLRLRAFTVRLVPQILATFH